MDQNAMTTSQAFWWLRRAWIREYDYPQAAGSWERLLVAAHDCDDVVGEVSERLPRHLDARGSASQRHSFDIWKQFLGHPGMSA